MDSRKIVRPGMNKPKGFSYFKTLIAAGVTFVMLVILVPLMTNHRAKVSSEKPEADKNKVVAEIPRSDATSDPAANSWSPAPQRDELPADSSVLRSQTPAQDQSAPPEPAKAPPPTQAPPPPPPAASTSHGGHAVPPSSEKTTAAVSAAHAPSASSGKGQSAVTAPVPSTSGSKAGQKTAATAGSAAQGAITVQKPKEQKTAAASSPEADAQKKAKEAQTARKSAKDASASPAVAALPAGKVSKAASDASSPTPSVKETKLSSVEAPKVEKPKGGIQYVIQVGAFQKMENAQAIQESYRKKGYAVQIRSHYDLNKGQLYLVQLEPMSDAGKANATMSRIRQDGAAPIMLKVGVGQ